MDEGTLEKIYNYRRLSDMIATAGQPTEEELTTVTEAGFEVVVNLALHDAEYSLPDERKTVESLGMRYIHLPVVWEHPTQDDLEDFFEIMDELAGKRVFVHCAANKRVSVFMALYRLRRQGWLPDVTMPDVLAIWEPDSVWQEFLEMARQVAPKHNNA
ncbi:MAG: protein tyrosine phosphatase family protein [Sulfuricaulis sp.]|uniref:protein tyrosine phosphatase family protein n=1 Tax=Sulfuricaulis sp. TaxID=2003553 RepID=UPI002600BD35|nr:protein tyrosine phosphatase family protein [Sulfuricaulis sp.]MCR4347508.1 protein tyrosine phosphatase family protein [Sulfuricaulis sp.]